MSVSSGLDVDLVSMATGMTTSSITADSALGTLTAGTATRSQVTIGATSQFSEVSIFMYIGPSMARENYTNHNALDINLRY